MELLNDLGKEVALSVILEKAKGGRIKSEEIGPFINSIREVLENVSARDHSYSFPYIPENDLTESN